MERRHVMAQKKVLMMMKKKKKEKKIIAETLMGKPKVTKVDVKQLQDPDLRKSSPAQEISGQSLFIKSKI